MDKNKTIQSVGEGIKSLPIFIGTDKKDVALGIEKYVNETYNSNENQDVKFVIALMGEEIYNKSLQLWYLGTLSEQEKERMKNFQTDKALESQAMNQAMNLEAGIPAKDWPLTPSKLKDHYAYYFNRKLSNMQVDELIGFMMSYGLMFNTTPNAKHHESLYALSINADDRIKSFQAARSKLLSHIDTLNLQIKGIDEDIAQIVNQNDKKEDKPHNEFETKEIESVDEEGDLKVTTEYLNDRGI